nr:ATP synthase F0 subunit 8 [Yoda sp. d ASH-2021]
MPQLDTYFWALNFVTIWLILTPILATTISLQLPLCPVSSPINWNSPFPPQWAW